MYGSWLTKSNRSNCTVCGTDRVIIVRDWIENRLSWLYRGAATIRLDIDIRNRWTDMSSATRNLERYTYSHNDDQTAHTQTGDNRWNSIGRDAIPERYKKSIKFEFNIDEIRMFRSTYAGFFWLGTKNSSKWLLVG